MYIDNVKVYDGSAYVNDWARENGYRDREDLRCHMLENGYSEEEFEEMWDETMKRMI